MDLHEAARLKRKLSLIGRTRTELPFLYTPAGPDGSPLLLVDAPRIDPATILALTREARSRDFVRGEVSREPETGRLLFFVRSGGAEGLTRFVEHLGGFLAEMVPVLGAAKVRPATD
ncbi:MAG: hypothetical protein ACI8S6_005734 [Myxococcota bacterium]|jgi:hypothetical protein